MRSLWYLLTGNPRNVDDCLDLAGDKAVATVSMELRVYEFLRDIFFITQYAVKLTWQFEPGEVTHEQILVGDIDCTGELRKPSIEKANRCLEQLLERIERAGIRVQGGARRFSLQSSCDVEHTPCGIRPT